MTVSGVVMIPNSPSFQDVNGTIVFSLTSVNVPCGVATNYIDAFPSSAAGRGYRIEWTRLTVWNKFNGSPDFSMPSGVKAVITILQTITTTPGTFRASTVAHFYKVVPDDDNYIDCGVSFSGFTFLGQFIPEPFLQHTFDATSATVTYS